MAAPPPLYHPAIAVDEDDDGFDWDAAVREIDSACALASASTTAVSTSAPPPPPSAAPSSGLAPSAAAPSFHGLSTGVARQSTLDRFVDSFTRRQAAKDRPLPAPSVPVEVAVPPGGGGAHFVDRGDEGCSRKASEEKVVERPRTAALDRFVDAFTRRQAAKERPPPVPGVPVAAAVPPGGGGAHFAVRGDEGCLRRGSEEEVAEGSCTVALDHEAVQTWIYPTNVEVREYQRYIVQKALFTNTLVALPTGLGKTFIAAVVMYNYFRWFPEGKIVFTAPSRPLVTQQIEACHNTVGIPQEWAIDMKGNLSPSTRSSLWKSKRVFFVTPQILENDIQSGICMVKQLVCLVIDEAHRASGNHAYCVAVRQLVAAGVPLRILALTATPGSKQPTIQAVINNLCISELIHRDESDLEVKRYVNTRTVELLKVPVGSDTTQVNAMILDLINTHVVQLRAAGVIDNRDAANWSPHQLLILRTKFSQAPPPNIPLEKKKEIHKSFAALVSLCHVSKMLWSHGIKPAHESIKAKLKEGHSWNFASKNQTFRDAMNMMQKISSEGLPSPKVQKLAEVLVDHFHKNDSKDSRVIIFSNFRESVNEILGSLRDSGGGLFRPAQFIGQSSTGDRLKGQTQKMQQAILQKFRAGEYNILVATSIGEEGLDIMEVDLVICFDANVSPLRMIQRMGRTGRKHEGRVVVLACEGPELQGYMKKQGSARTMKNLLRKGNAFEYHSSPRMVPHVYSPEVKYVKLSIEKYVHCSKKRKVDVSGTPHILNKVSEEDGLLIAQYFSSGKEDTWKPSLVAFPSFQVSPCDIYRVPHSYRTTDMLIDTMQQLQDVSFSKTKCGSPLQEPADVAAFEDQVLDGYHFSSGEVSSSKSASVPSSLVNKYPLHSFFSGEYVAVDVRGYISITFVPALPRVSEFHKDTRNVNWEHTIQNKTTSKLTADASGQLTDSAYSIFAGNALNSAPHFPEYSEQCNQADGTHILSPSTPSKTVTSPIEKWDTPCNAKLASPVLSGEEDMELSPRLTHYIEEGIVPESPVEQLEIDSAADLDFVAKVISSKSHIQGAEHNRPECSDGPLSFVREGQFPAGVTEHHGSSRENILVQTQAETDEPMCSSKAKIYCSPAAHTPTANLLSDSMSDDWQPKSIGNTSGSVQQLPKYRRLRKCGDKIKRVSSLSLNERYNGSVGGQCDQMEHYVGNRRKAKRCMDIYIDEEVEVSEDADISPDEDDDRSEDKYEDSFIDDQTTPTGQFTQSEQGGENSNTNDMMAFYRRSLLSQSTVVLPSRYQDVSDNSVSRAGSASCSSGNLHNPIETPQGIPQIYGTTDPSPIGHQQMSLERASSIKEQGEASVVNCESTTKPDSRKRKLSFEQAASIPVINLELEPAPPSSHVATEVGNDIYWDDAFFENLDFDAIEAQAAEQLRLQKAQSAQKPTETKRASDVSFTPPSFDLGI
ncbi:DEAD-box ATP-dependent RNA helicase FANCM-like isoform X1 [Triticum dicoccoides]|uniref:DEAD-box ATP-dependent RNA helicase FANCM-like isoform X1 n=1 Tax=Triticum dicoccoides TaxID=85692 RepID=UPI001890035C|nr:DEAD-box ATP-dependent RNA helicase FANCM-like isoform X1 [Triticum dicoccoides]